MSSYRQPNVLPLCTCSLMPLETHTGKVYRHAAALRGTSWVFSFSCHEQGHWLCLHLENIFGFLVEHKHCCMFCLNRDICRWNQPIHHCRSSLQLWLHNLWIREMCSNGFRKVGNLTFIKHISVFFLLFISNFHQPFFLLFNTFSRL